MIRNRVQLQPRPWLTWVVVIGVLGLTAFVGYRLVPRQQMLVGGLVAACVASVLILRRVEVGLLGLVLTAVTVTFSIGTGTQTSIPFPLLLAPSLLGLWLVKMLRERDLRLYPSRTMWPLLGLVVVSIISWLASLAFWDIHVPVASNRLWVQLGQLSIFWLSPALFLLAANGIREERWLRYIVFAFIALGLAAVVNAILLHDFKLAPGYYFTGTSGLFGPWVVSLAYGQLLFNRRLRPLWRWVFVLAIAGWIWWAWFHSTNWLSGWVPFVVGLVVITWQRSRRWALILLVILVLISAGARDFVYRAFVTPEVMGGSARRPEIWQAAVEVGQRSPIIGLGPGNYMYYFRAYAPQRAMVSHNNYIDVFNQFGLIGLAMLLWFLIESGRLGWRLRSHCARGGFAQGYVASVLGGLVGIIVGMMLGDWFLPYVYNIGLAGFRHSLYSWLFLGGLVVLERLVWEEHRGS
jgi:O-antigen ligase